jgi:hypothetical protein
MTERTGCYLLGAACLAAIVALAACSREATVLPEITSFNIGATSGIIDQGSGRIVVPLAKDTSFAVTALVPEFGCEGGTVYVGSAAQESGKSAQDFSSDVEYRVEGPSVTVRYTVSVYRTGSLKLKYFEYFTLEDDGLGLFTNYSRAGNSVWSWSNKGGQAEYAYMTGYYEGAANDDWVITKVPIDLSSATDAVIRFSTAMNYDASTSGVTLLVSTDYDGSGDPVSFPWTDLSAKAVWADAGWTWTPSGDVSLAKWAGRKLWIAFRYICAGKNGTTMSADSWELDNIEILVAE